MNRSSESTAQVREHFRRKAFSFDHLYDEEHALQRLLRPGLFNRRELAVSIAHEYDAPSVLDVGGGSARVGEFMLDAGASLYVDIDLSDTMLGLAKERLDRFGDRSSSSRATFDRPARGPVRHRPRPRLLRLHRGRSGAHPADVRAVQRDGRRQLPSVDMDEGPDPQGALRDDQPLPDLRLHGQQLRELFSDFPKVEIQSGRSGFLLRADRERS